MLRSLIEWKLSSEEKRLGASLDYLRFILRVSIPAFLKFGKILPFANYRRSLPPDVYHIARIVATKSEDCGTCVKMELKSAKDAGISDGLIHAALNDDVQGLSENLKAVREFTKSVIEAKEPCDELRQRLVTEFGEQGLVELAFSIAACRVFPTVKRSLGYASSCEAAGL